MVVAQRRKWKPTMVGSGKLHRSSDVELSLDVEIDAHQTNIFIPGGVSILEKRIYLIIL